MDIDYKRYRVPGDGSFRLGAVETDDDQDCSKKEARKLYSKNLKKLVRYQEKLFAEKKQSLLVVMQAMDTGGKDSTIRKIVGPLNPQGCHVTGFKAPSDEELAHDFLWRVHDHAPPKGHISIFNRSHYEDVLVVRVHNWAAPDLIKKRYRHINEFERMLADHNCTILKIMLHISPAYQLERLRRRLMEPDKHWKFNPGDLAERKLWSQYMEAYEWALNECSTDYAPWYVIPAENRWFRDAVVSEILADAFKTMDPEYPQPDFDPADYPPDSLN